MQKVAGAVGRKKLIVWVEGEVGEGGERAAEGAKRKERDGVCAGQRGEETWTWRPFGRIDRM